MPKTNKSTYYYENNYIAHRRYVNRKLHRVDGPAVEYVNVFKIWYVDGKRHRIDGPAVEWADGDKELWVDDKRYTKEEFDELIEEVSSMNVAMKLIDPREWVRELGKKEVV